MPLAPELQRLLARGPGSLPDVLVVDVGAIARWVFETDPGANIWPTVIDTARRTHRRVAWILAETTLPSPGVEASTLDRIQADLQRAFGSVDVLRATEPASSLLAALHEEGRRKLGVITAGIDERPYELWLLDYGIAAAMLDVASGRLWTHASASEIHGDPFILPRLHAILGPEAGAAALIREARNYRAQLHEAAKRGLPFEEAELPPRVKAALVQKKLDIDSLAAKLRGDDRPDAIARARLRDWLIRPGRVVEVGRTDTAYVLAEVDRTADRLAVKRVSIRIGDSHHAVQDHERGMALLRDTVERGPHRWFMPHALDVLGTMADHRIPLPASVIDPAYIVFALDPDAPPSVAEQCWAALSLSSAARHWLEDERRELPFPSTSRDYNDLVEILPVLDRSLTVALQREGLEDLLENDIGPTLPVLAKIERHGVGIELPIGYASWDRVRHKFEQRLDFLEKILVPPFDRLDPYHADLREFVPLLKRKYGLLPDEWWSSDLSFKDEFKRYVVWDAPEAVAIARARSIEKSSFYWLPLLHKARGRIRGMHVPQTTGRWGFRALPLHSLPKRSPEGRLFRSAFRGPEGYELVGADFNAFEVRLLAALSSDPVLTLAASMPDMHADLARRLFGASSRERRELAKIGVYSIIYGQSEASFRRHQATLAHADSTALYQQIKATLPVSLAYRDQELHKFKTSKFVTTRGGWRRWAPDKCEAFSTLIQGLGADILRRVLRELDRQLATVDAFIVHQAHDEVIVASRPECADDVAQILATTMTSAATRLPSLFPSPVSLDVKIRRGKRWSDLL